MSNRKRRRIGREVACCCRDALLLKVAFKGWGPAEIAKQYGTSEPMARFQLNASGVLVQVGRSRAAKARRASRTPLR
jgi:hypothetical protein